MIERGARLSVMRQCELLKLPRSTVYHRPRAAATNDLELMRKIDELHLAWPWMGSRSIRDQLVRAGFPVCRDRVRRLMRKMGIRAVYRRPCTTIPAPGQQVYPYLLKDLTIDRPNQAWAADITYLPMARGFLYLVAIMDWYSRKVLSWRLSNTLTADFCVAALDEALRCFGPPGIFNTDQGSQFTGSEFIGRLKEAGVRISMDGKGRWLDNVFIERLWRSVKYEEVYMNAYDSVADARSGLQRYFGYYNTTRTHQSLGSRTPDEVYFQTSGLREAA
jgi:putative transposase